eukprot:Em0002g364a
MNEEFESSRESDSESCSSNPKPERTPEHNPEEHHKPEPVKWTLKVLKQEAKEKGIKKWLDTPDDGIERGHPYTVREHPHRKRRARALARTRVKLRRPYRLQTTLDLGELVLVARYDASREKACTASATRGIHVHPNSEHLASLAECFLSSAATAADPAVRPASKIKDLIHLNTEKDLSASQLDTDVEL